MTEHPQESLPAFVLGMLEGEEAFRVAQHIQHCPVCQAEVDDLQAVMTFLPYAAEPQMPPERVKRQLFARIAAHSPQPVSLSIAPHSQPSKAPTQSRRRQWTNYVTAAAVAVALLFGYTTYTAQSQVAALEAAKQDKQALVSRLEQERNAAQQTLINAQNALTQAEQAIASGKVDLQQAEAALTTARQAQEQAQQQLIALQSENQNAITFISQTKTVNQVLVPQRPGVEGRMYMQEGHNRVVLVLAGLPPLAEGKTYQFWFANSAGQVPSRTFTVDQNGLAEIVIDAPEPVDGYLEVMVTIEDSGGSVTPSQEVVVAAEL
jgi:anti-sigma-K factor RskA